MKTYAILSAFLDEMDPYKEIIHNAETKVIDDVVYQIGEIEGKKVIVSPTGFGTTSAATITTHLIANFHPDTILFSGTAGGVNEALSIGDVVIADKAFEAEIQGAFDIFPGTPFESALIHPVRNEKLTPLINADQPLLEKAKELHFDNINVQYGTIVATNTFPSPKSLFKAIKSKNALAIEMEASALYFVGKLFKTPTLVIRGISNLLNSEGDDISGDQTDVPLASKNAAEVLLKILENI